MTLLALGLSHRSTPIDVLERVAVPGGELPKALASVIQREHVLEAVVLSTCNRVEVYADVTRFHGGVADLRDHFAEWGGIDPATITPLLYERFDRDAAAHLFAVASGLESMVVGERQIHGQVRAAFAAAVEERTAGSVLNRVFRQAIRVGRRARAETGLADGAASMVDLALATARQEMPEARPRVLLVGAGKIGGMAGTRIAEIADHVTVANRTPQKADSLAARIGGVPVGLDALVEHLAAADLVICSTDATQPVVTVDAVREAMLRRPDRPMVLVDLAVPRDVEHGTHSLPRVSVVDIEALRGVVAQGPTGDAVRDARRIVAAEADDFLSWTRGVQAGPTIAALRQRAEQVRLDELERLRSKLGDLSDGQRDAVDALTKGILNTFLHEPTVRLKGLVDSPDGERFIRALAHLFDLHPADGGAPPSGGDPR